MTTMSGRSFGDGSFDSTLTKDQIAKILDPGASAYGITASFPELQENPYILAEQFVGENADDTISFTKIDHGMLPAPELGGDALADDG